LAKKIKHLKRMLLVKGRDHHGYRPLRLLASAAAMLADPFAVSSIRAGQEVTFARTLRSSILLRFLCFFAAIQDFLLSEHGEAMILMATLKRAIDPGNIMNPGKIVRL
jgi:FAD linked oxidases, C-terminal domain